MLQDSGKLQDCDFVACDLEIGQTPKEKPSVG